ncbi:DUF2716 domain-containing protein [Streptomyces sp. SID3343]|nr:DUF2716 domain-containing protein [Streptomyces sp. SID3343]
MTRDLRLGTFGHPWEDSLCVVGDDLPAQAAGTSRGPAHRVAGHRPSPRRPQRRQHLDVRAGLALGPGSRRSFRLLGVGREDRPLASVLLVDVKHGDAGREWNDDHPKPTRRTSSVTGRGPSVPAPQVCERITTCQSVSIGVRGPAASLVGPPPRPKVPRGAVLWDSPTAPKRVRISGVRVRRPATSRPMMSWAYR